MLCPVYCYSPYQYITHSSYDLLQTKELNSTDARKKLFGMATRITSKIYYNHWRTRGAGAAEIANTEIRAYSDDTLHEKVTTLSSNAGEKPNIMAVMRKIRQST
jgi:hypothetical protein